MSSGATKTKFRFRPLQTGQLRCYDTCGCEIRCRNSGQDAETQYGVPWPAVRFKVLDEVVTDQLTGLSWTKSANFNGFPLSWQESLDRIVEMNNERTYGHCDWRLPNRRELRSLMSYGTKKPSLPENHPFDYCFQGWYWTSTTAAIHPAYAWYIHLEGARMFYGRKDQYCLFWPVRGAANYLLQQTGQRRCFDAHGNKIPCLGSGQDGEYRHGCSWHQPRFVIDDMTVTDNLTGLCWLKETDLTGGAVNWQEALQAVSRMNHDKISDRSDWQLPNINALESLIDCSQHSPALPIGHPFTCLREGYWSSTTSSFETDWSWVLYLRKGALGVGHKSGRTFYVWPVCYVL